MFFFENEMLSFCISGNNLIPFALEKPKPTICQPAAF